MTLMLDKPLSVGDLRKKLLDNGYSEEDVKLLKKKDLRKIYEGVVNANSTLDSVVVQNGELNVEAAMPKTTEIEPTEETKPKLSDVNWTDYVLGLLDESELINGNPKVDGLRRVSYLIFGPSNIRTHIVDSPRMDNGMRATVIVTVEFLQNRTIFDGAADVYSGNTDKKFAVHPVAVAETRAEGRALRKALRLVKVLAAEELMGPSEDEPTGIDNRIPQTMLNGLEQMCHSVGIDLVRTANNAGIKIGLGTELNQAQGIQLSNVISDYRRGAKEIPDEIKK